MTAATSHHMIMLFSSFDLSCHVSLLGLTFSESSSVFVFLQQFKVGHLYYHWAILPAYSETIGGYDLVMNPM